MVKDSLEQVQGVAKDLLARNLVLVFVFVVLPISLVGFNLAALGFMFLFDAAVLMKLAGAALIAIGMLSPWLGLRLARLGLRLPARRLVRQAQAKEAAAVRQALDALEGAPALYDATLGPRGGAIAVAPSTGRLSIAIGDMQQPQPQLRTWVVSREDLGEVRALEAGPWQSPAGVGVAALRKAIANREAHFSQVGLAVQSRDVHVPELLLQLDAERARRWERLLEQFRLGTLPAPSAPTVFPS